jgi:hypothetical protein
MAPTEDYFEKIELAALLTRNASDFHQLRVPVQQN